MQNLVYRLGWFQKNFDNRSEAGDLVRANVQLWDAPRDQVVGGQDVQLSEMLLTVRANARGNTTWDEQDVADEIAAQYGHPVLIVRPLEREEKLANIVSTLEIAPISPDILQEIIEATEPSWFERFRAWFASLTR